MGVAGRGRAVRIEYASHTFALGPADGDALRQSLLAYEKAAIAEWPLTTHGQYLPAAEKALMRLGHTYEDIGRRRTGESASPLPELRGVLDTIDMKRTSRILEGGVNTGLNTPLWTILFIASGLVLVSGIVFQRRGETRDALPDGGHDRCDGGELSVFGDRALGPVPV